MTNKDHDNRPTISVVMATYNGEKWIREQLDSIISQTYPIHELIIQDDCSTDSTLEIIKEYERQYAFIHVYQNEKNKGYCENFMSVTMKATGDFIALADQDDIWYPEKLEKQINAIGESDMCYSQHHRGYDQVTMRLVDYKCAPERQMFSPIVGHSMLLRKEYAQDSRNWLKYIPHDFGLGALAHFGNGVTKVSEPLNWHRTHNGQASAKGHVPSQQQRGIISACKPYIFGYIHYRRLQKQQSFIRFYETIHERSKGRNELCHTISKLLLSPGIIPLIRLCFLCMTHRDTIYPTKTKGIKGMMRGFFYPFIHSYKCDLYLI